MGKRNSLIPQYGDSLIIDGYPYQVSLRFTGSDRAAEDVPVHSHAQYELLAFFNGSSRIQVEQMPPMQLHGGQCCLLRPNVYHLRQASADTTKYVAMNIQGDKGSPLERLGCPCLLLDCAPELLSWFRMLEQELSGPTLGKEASIRALVSLVLVRILRELSGQSQQVPAPQAGALARYEDIIDDFLALHYAEDLRISDVAEQAGITTRHLARIMQSSYGCTFRQRLLEIRLYHAQKYLSTTQLPVSQIAIRCGFTAENAFCAAFRKKLGYTPSGYRRQLAHSPSQSQYKNKNIFITEDHIMQILKDIATNLVDGDASAVVELVQQAIDSGVSAQQILNDGLMVGMNEVSVLFQEEELFIPDVLMSARAMSMGSNLLKPLLNESDKKSAGKVCIGTVQGDLHDIGKNLVRMMMEAKGLEVIDLGVDVSAEKFVSTAVNEGCQIICCSALLTTTMSVMGEVVEKAKEAGIREKVTIMVGGAPVTEDFCKSVGADIYTTDAASAAQAAVAALTKEA